MAVACKSAGSDASNNLLCPLSCRFHSPVLLTPRRSCRCLLFALAIILSLAYANDSPSNSITASGSCSASSSSSLSATGSPSAPRGTSGSLLSQTQSDSEVPSRSISATASQSLTRSPSATPSQTDTETSSPSQTPSWTPSATLTSSRTPSATLTPSRTPSATLTPSRTPSATRTPSRTPSKTFTPSCTPSVTSTPSRTPSVTQSRSLTSTLTPSTTVSSTQSQSKTVTQTVTQSPSATGSPSQSETLTRSASLTQSGSPTQSQSASETRTASSTTTPSQSLTTSQSGTSSQTKSESPSLTQSSSPSYTQTSSSTPSVTQTRSLTGTLTPSSTESPTQSRSKTATKTISQSPSTTGSPTQSQTPSYTTSPSTTQTQSASLSQSMSPTQSQSASETHTSSATVTPSQSLTTSQSGTLSQTQSHTSSLTQTATQSETVTQTSSPAPFRMGFQQLSSRTALDAATPPSSSSLVTLAGPPLAVSDSTPIKYLALWLNRCPEHEYRALGNMTLTCDVHRAGGSEPMVFVSVLPAASGFDLEDACEVAVHRPGFAFESDAQQVKLPVVVSLSAQFGTVSGIVTMSCRLTVENSLIHIADAFALITVSSTHWPLALDAVMFAPASGHTDTMTSTLFGPVDPVTMRKAMSAAACGRVPTYADMVFGTCALNVVRGIYENVSLPDSAVPAGLASPFDVNVTNTRLVVFRATFSGAFSISSTVSVGGVPAVIAAASNDGRWLSFFTPNASTMCGPVGTAAGRCGRVVLSLSSHADGSGQSSRGATLACPPFCAGDLLRMRWSTSARGESVVPHPRDETGTSFAPAIQSSISSGAVVWLQPDSASQSSGLRYATSCMGAGYTDPASGACANESDPASFRCAYGVNSCEDCRRDALCPGGTRLWPRAGYFAFSETDASVTACAPPDPSLRCIGWDAVRSVTLCGAAYRQGSYLCDACAKDFYPDGTGACSACPQNATTWSAYKGLVIILGVVFGLVAVAYGLLVILVQKYGGTLRSTAGHAGLLLAWAIMTLQGVAQVSTVTSSSLPPLLSRLFGSLIQHLGVASLQLSVLNLRGIVLPPACSGVYPFATEVFTMTSFVLLVLLVGVFAFAASKLPSRSTAFELAGRFALTAGLIALAPAVTDASALLYCTKVTVNAKAVEVLDGGSALAAKIGPSGTDAVLVLASNPYFVCWEPSGAHRTAAYVAVGTLAVAILLGPLGLYYLVRTDVGLENLRERGDTCAARALTCPRRASSIERVTVCDRDADHGSKRAGARSSALLAPVLRDFRPEAWFTKFVDLFLTILLAIIQATLQHPTTPTLLVIKAVIIIGTTCGWAVHILVTNPYLANRSWMATVRSLLLLVAGGCAALNAVASAVDLGLVTPGSALDTSFTVASVMLMLLLAVAVGALLRGVGQAMVFLAKTEQAAKELRMALQGTMLDDSETSGDGGSRRRRLGIAVVEHFASRNVTEKSFRSGRIAELSQRNKPLFTPFEELAVDVNAPQLQRSDSGLSSPRSSPRLRRNLSASSSWRQTSNRAHRTQLQRQDSSQLKLSPRRNSAGTSPQLQRQDSSRASPRRSFIGDFASENSGIMFQNPMLLRTTRSHHQVHRSSIRGPGLPQTMVAKHKAAPSHRIPLDKQFNFEITSPYRRTGATQRRPATCSGCIRELCAVCNSPSSMRIRTAVHALEVDLRGASQPERARDTCLELLNALEEEEGAMPLNVIAGSVIQSAELLRTYPHGRGVVMIASATLVLAVDIIDSLSTGRQRRRRRSASVATRSFSNEPAVLTDALRQLRIVLLLEHENAAYAAVALSATCEALSQLSRHAGKVPGDGSLLHAFAAAGTAEALVLAIRACIPMSQKTEEAMSALEWGLEAAANVTVDRTSAARFVSTGGIEELMVLLGLAGTTRLSVSGMANTVSILCNIAVGHAPDLLDAKALPALIEILDLSLSDDCDKSLFTAIAEPACWALRLLLKQSAWRVDGNSISDAKCLMLILEKVLLVTESQAPARMQAASHAQATKEHVKHQLEDYELFHMKGPTRRPTLNLATGMQSATSLPRSARIEEMELPLPSTIRIGERGPVVTLY